MLQVALNNDDGFSNQLLYNQFRLRRFTSLTPKLIAITSNYSPERRRVERFLERGFRHGYGAEISRHYPTLMSVQDENGMILGALGFRYADREKLFLEHYLDEAVEDVMAGSASVTTGRNKIVEVGNLASKGNGASIFLFTALTAYLVQQQREIITVTATNSLHRYFTRLGIETLQLGVADQNRLPDFGKSWGDYYETSPRILAGHIIPAYRKLQRYLQLNLVEESAGVQARLHPRENER